MPLLSGILLILLSLCILSMLQVVDMEDKLLADSWRILPLNPTA